MAKKKRSLEKEDVSELYSQLWEQITEDRTDIKDIYEELRNFVKDHPLRFAELGDTLAKLADLRIKQTSQVLDIVKEAQKAQSKSENESFTADDFESIRAAIEKQGDKNGD